MSEKNYNSAIIIVSNDSTGILYNIFTFSIFIIREWSLIREVAKEGRNINVIIHFRTKNNSDTESNNRK